MQRIRLPLFTLLVITGLSGCSAADKQQDTCENSRLFACQENKSPAQPGVIQQASLFSQGDKLYVMAEMEQNYLKRLAEFLNTGEPVWASYSFRLYRNHPWLPDLRIGQVTVKRRLRLRLVTRRFEMLDGQTGQIQYTSNPEEAMSFLGAPRYVPLGTLTHNRKKLSSDHSYRLEVALTLEHEDMSTLLHLLDQWFSFGQSSQFYFQTAYTP